MKKGEKERLDSKKAFESKEIAMEKVRKERDELWAIVNTDKYKNVRTIEIEREKAEKQKAEVEQALKLIKEQQMKTVEKMKETEQKMRDLEIQAQRQAERD